MKCWYCDEEVIGEIGDRIVTVWEGRGIIISRYPASLCDSCAIKEILKTFDEFAEKHVVINGVDYGPLLTQKGINWTAFVRQEQWYRNGTYSEDIFIGHMRILGALGVLRDYKDGWFVSRPGLGMSNPYWHGFSYFANKADARAYGEARWGKDRFELLRVSGGKRS